MIGARKGPWLARDARQALGTAPYQSAHPTRAADTATARASSAYQGAGIASNVQRIVRVDPIVPKLVDRATRHVDQVRRSVTRAVNFALDCIANSVDSRK